MATERQHADFGASLREAREGKGVSLRTIADATKISVRALEALERNDISQLPGGIFSRAFVRAYALQVGLDPEETIADFLNTFPHESVVQGHPRTRHQLVEGRERPPKRPALPVARVVLAGLAVVAIALYFGLVGRQPAGGPVEPVAEAAAAARASSLETPSSGALMVVVEAHSVCTVTVATDGSTGTSHALQPGDRLRVHAERELLLSASDPAALYWTINGSEAKPLSGPVRLTPDNAGTFLLR